MMSLCALFGTGCGSSDEDDEGTTLEGEPLDCAWLASNNCWKTTVAAATACVPPADETGVLSADGASCTYASGASVAFHNPLVLPIDFENPPLWDFTQSQGGQACVTFNEEDESSQLLTVQGMTFEERGVGFGLQVTCPDGKKYAAENAFDLLDCDNFFEDAPGYSDSSSDFSVTFSLLNGTGNGLAIFDCAR
jgi:hypothetical protein